MNPALSPIWDEVIRRCLAKNANERYSSARVMDDAIQAAWQKVKRESGEWQTVGVAYFLGARVGNTLNNVAAVPRRLRPGFFSRYIRVFVMLVTLMLGALAVGALTVVATALPSSPGAERAVAATGSGGAGPSPAVSRTTAVDRHSPLPRYSWMT